MKTSTNTRHISITMGPPLSALLVLSNRDIITAPYININLEHCLGRRFPRASHGVSSLDCARRI